MTYPKYSLLAVPYARMELPGWGRVLRLAGVHEDARWAGAPGREIRGKWHGYWMKLELSDWSERLTYFLGRFYDLGTQLFVRAGVREGDTFVDVGGNIGMITLLAARLVGTSGRVETFEPNPDVFRRLSECVQHNRLEGIVRLHNKALADEPGELMLSVLTEHSGMGTLTEVTGHERTMVSRTYSVRVERGDSVLGHDLKGPLTIKIDVEGFECRVLRGIEGTLRRLRPAVVNEVAPGHLERAGASVKQLFELLESHGYRGYALATPYRGVRHVLSLRPATPDNLRGNNVAWIHPDSVHQERLSRWIEGQ